MVDAYSGFSSFFRTALLVALIVSLASCSPVRDRRGYIPEAEKIASISVGVDTKDSVNARLGSPSTVATFDTDVWFYISSME